MWWISLKVHISSAHQQTEAANVRLCARNCLMKSEIIKFPLEGHNRRQTLGLPLQIKSQP
jgi:hypothetical protein